MTPSFPVCVTGQRELSFSEGETTKIEPGLGEARPQVQFGHIVSKVSLRKSRGDDKKAVGFVPQIND